MEFEDILKIIGAIVFFVVTSFFNSKKGKQKKEEARRKAARQNKHAQENASTSSNQESSNDFFDEVRRMLDNANEDTQTSQQQKSFGTTDKFEIGLSDSEPISTVANNYFEKEYEEEESLHFPKNMPTAQQEATAQTSIIENSPPMETKKIKKKSKAQFDLKKAIIHQVILERKYE